MVHMTYPLGINSTPGPEGYSWVHYLARPLARLWGEGHSLTPHHSAGLLMIPGTLPHPVPRDISGVVL